MDEDDTKKKIRRACITYTAGAIFGVGWWLFIAVAVLGYDGDNCCDDPVITGEWLIGVLSTIGLMMINALNWTNLNSFSLSGEEVELKHRIWLVASFVVMIAGLIASVWVGVQVHLLEGGAVNGITLIVQNLLIFAAAIVFHFSKPQPDSF